jgi:alkaline phosphatase
VDSFLNGISNYSWPAFNGPDVLFGGGAEQFLPSSKSFQGKDYYDEFTKKGYNLIQNNTALKTAPDTERTLGIFSVSNMAKWLDRNVYKNNTQIPKTSPDGSNATASDQPGLKEMTLKAIDILHKRNPEKGFFLMSEAASIDKVHSFRLDPSCLPC